MDQISLDKAKKVKITAASPFTQGPCYGSLDGEPVTITHVGDAEGLSPVYLVFDSNGRSAWVSQESVVVTDPRFLPTSVDEAISSSRTRTPAGMTSR